jgi:uncharacterized protein involved in outer membrane biogenesis
VLAGFFALVDPRNTFAMRKPIAAIIVLLSLCVLLALLTVNLLVTRNKPFLLERAERILGRQVKVSEIEVSLLPLCVRFDNLAVSDDPAYASGLFFEARSLQLSMELLPLLLQRVRIKSIAVQNPRISVIRNEMGSYNFSTLGKVEKNGATENRKRSSNDARRLWLKPPLLVRNVEVVNGIVRYLDTRSDLTATQVDLKITDFALNAPFTLELALAIFAPKQNIRIRTSLGPIDGASAVTEVPLDGRIDAQELNMDELRAAAPTLRKTLPKALDLRGVYTIKDLTLQGTLSHPRLRGAIEGTEASVRFD